jgi:hypothetical protein
MHSDGPKSKAPKVFTQKMSGHHLESPTLDAYYFEGFVGNSCCISRLFLGTNRPWNKQETSNSLYSHFVGTCHVVSCGAALHVICREDIIALFNSHKDCMYEVFCCFSSIKRKHIH